MVGIVTPSNNAKFCQSAPDRLLSVNNLPMLLYQKLSVLNYYCQTTCHYWSLAVTAPALKTAHSKKVVAGRRLKLSCKVRVSRCWKVKVLNFLKVKVFNFLKVKVFILQESESFHIVWKWTFSHFWKVKVFKLFESERFLHWRKVKVLHCLKVKVFALLRSKSESSDIVKKWMFSNSEFAHHLKRKIDFLYNNGNEKFYARRLRTRYSPGQQSRGTRMAHSCPHKIPALPSHQRSKIVVCNFSLNQIFGSTNFRVFTHLLLGNGQVWWWAPLVLVMGDITGRNIQEIVARFSLQNVPKQGNSTDSF